MSLNFSIDKEPVIDCAMEGWPDDKRREFQQESREVHGMTSVGGAGHSTTRVRYSSEADAAKIRSQLTELANKILPGHNFVC